MRCPQCANKVLQKSDAGTKVRIKGPIIISDGIFKSQCYWCNTAIQVPVSALEGESTPIERFVLTK